MCLKKKSAGEKAPRLCAAERNRRLGAGRDVYPGYCDFHFYCAMLFTLPSKSEGERRCRLWRVAAVNDGREDTWARNIAYVDQEGIGML